MASYSRGQVVWAEPDPTVGREQGGRRPFLIVASDDYLRIVTTLVLAVPVTTTDRGWANHVPLAGPVGLSSPSWAMTEQVRVLSRERLKQVAGYVDTYTLEAIDQWLRDFLDLREVR